MTLCTVGRGLPWWLSGKESTCQCRTRRFNPWVRKIPWRRKWQPTLVCLPGKSHGQRSLVGYSPWGLKESDTTQWLNNNNRHDQSTLWKFGDVILEKWSNMSRSLQMDKPEHIWERAKGANVLGRRQNLSQGKRTELTKQFIWILAFP